MDIKTIATGIGLVITIAGLFVYQGQLIQRIDVLEAQTAPNIKPLEQDIAINKAEIALFALATVNVGLGKVPFVVLSVDFKLSEDCFNEFFDISLE